MRQCFFVLRNGAKKWFRLRVYVVSEIRQLISDVHLRLGVHVLMPDSDENVSGKVHFSRFFFT